MRFIFYICLHILESARVKFERIVQYGRSREMSAQYNPMDSYEVDKVTITGRNITISGPMREHIHDKIQKIELLTPPVISVHVILEMVRELFKAEIIYKFSHFEVTAHAVMDDMYMAIDLAASRLRRKVIKWKTLIQEHHAKKLTVMEFDIKILDMPKETLDDFNDMIEEENYHEMEEMLAPPKIMKVEKRIAHMLTESEAAMRMDLSSDSFMVYRSEEDQKLKVIYRRRNRGLGVLEIE